MELTESPKSLAGFKWGSRQERNGNKRENGRQRMEKRRGGIEGREREKKYFIAFDLGKYSSILVGTNGVAFSSSVVGIDARVTKGIGGESA